MAGAGLVSHALVCVQPGVWPVRVRVRHYFNKCSSTLAQRSPCALLFPEPSSFFPCLPLPGGAGLT